MKGQQVVVRRRTAAKKWTTICTRMRCGWCAKWAARRRRRCSGACGAVDRFDGERRQRGAAGWSEGARGFEDARVDEGIRRFDEVGLRAGREGRSKDLAQRTRRKKLRKAGDRWPSA